MRELIFSVICCTLVSLSSGNQDKPLGKVPQIDILNSTLYLNKGDNLTLMCSGHKEVQWVVNTLGPLSSPEPEGHAIVYHKQEQDNGRHAVQLNMTNSQYYDTGRYSCLFIDTVKDYAQPNSSVYIYVKDPDNLWIGHKNYMLPLFVFINRNEAATVACKVTNPSANVSLIKYQGQKDIAQQEDVTYDPEVGFILHYPNVLLSGMYKCIAEFNETVDEMLVVLKYRHTLKVMPPITIEVTPSASILVNESVKLTCSVKVDKSTMIQMEWSYPNKDNNGRIRPSIATRQPMKSGDATYSQISKSLDIDKIKLEDRGVYRCTIKNFDQTAFADQIIDVYEKTFVYLTQSDDVEVVVGDKKAFLYFEINAFPSPELEWYFEDKKIENNRFYSYGQVDHAAALTVFQPTRDKMGKYVLKAKTPDMTANASMNLIIKGPPEVSWIGKPPVKPLAGTQVTLECQTISYPVASISWLFNNCTEDNCTDWINITDTNLRYQVTGTQVESQLKIWADKTGSFRCYGENNFGSSFVETEFMVVDILNGFGFGEISHKVTECDKRLELECYGSLWIYKSMVIYKFQDEPEAIVSMSSLNVTDIFTNTDVENDSTAGYYNVSDNTVTPTTELSGFTSIIGSTGYSIVRTALFENLSKKDAGIYQCFGLKFDNTLDSTRYTLKFHDSIKPFIRESASGKIRAEKSTSLSLDCQVGGFPIPNVKWYKDGEIIYSNNTLNIGYSQNGFRIMIENATEVHAGNYICEASNCGGKTSSNMTLLVGGKPRGAGLSSVYIGIIVGILVATIIIIIIIVIFIKRMRTSLVIKMKDYEQYLLPPKGDYNPEIPIDEQTASLPYDPLWEFPKDRLRMGNVLGQGAFGRVIKTEAIGIADEDVTIVAVKMVKDCTDKEQMMALLSELKILIHIGQHLNILNLLGAVTKNIRFGELYVIVEYCHFGNVRSYLLKNQASFVNTMEDYSDPAFEKKMEAAGDKNKPYYVNKPVAINSADLIGPPLTTKNLICWSFQAARGMEYLASKKYIHRDLAARNVLLSEDNVIKISDFGLAKDCYKNMEYKKKGDGPVPVKWMALESLTHKCYTTKSDVWSYGVLMYELFSLGGNPYSGIELNEKFIGLLKSGYRMEKPEHASDDIYKVMLQCWDADPEKRPSFTQLVNRMGDFLEENVKQYYLDLNCPYQKSPDYQKEPLNQDGYLKMTNGISNVAPVTGSGNYTGDDDIESARYVNQSRWKKEKADDIELQPLTGGNLESVISNGGATPIKSPKGEPNSPIQLRTRADIHCPDDTDSGHSSSYAPGTSPVDNNGYLEPKILEEPEKGLAHKSDRLSANSNGVRGNSLFNDYPPPAYREVMQKNDPGALPV